MRYTIGMDVSAALIAINWNRKLWHLAGGVVAISIPLLLPYPWPFFLALGTLLTWVTVESMRRREPWFGRLFFTLSSPFVRHYERRKFVGNTWFALSITILTAIFRDPILVSAALVGWTFGDPAAEIVGRAIPSKKLFNGEKTVAGSIGCFFVSAVAYWGFFQAIGTGGDILSASLIGATATTLAEVLSLSFAVNDNFTIPLMSALALSFVLI